ncbi:hypothetical protein UFOVP833_32 [uncultured Caudovirales phage]|uniref:Uncharacterized protein n=1 Tax=uncultured Caudovirales phage TaxID=2100421 RepID=A0A6J5STZ9_9CAUD|nr:hypothetical protein UFOVP833_32 [uncultured Caudovirales phage]CAB4218809.1 hypothetical protein UFOVP1603_55 [uncultured Caudovirales phage]
MIAAKLKALYERAATPLDLSREVPELRLWNLKAGVLDVLNDIDRQLFNANPSSVISDLLGDRPINPDKEEARQ